MCFCIFISLIHLLPKNCTFPWKIHVRNIPKTLVRAEPRHGWDNKGVGRNYRVLELFVHHWNSSPSLSPTQALLFHSLFLFLSQDLSILLDESQREGVKQNFLAHSGLCFLVGLAGCEHVGKGKWRFFHCQKSLGLSFFHLMTALIRT